MVATTPNQRAFDWRPFFQSYGLLLSLFLLCTIISLSSDRFLTIDNLRNVLRQASINGIISIGMMLVILMRGLDLSVGSVLALSTVIAADLLSEGQVGPLGAIGVAVVVGLAGAVNSALVTLVKIPPFIATLGMMTFARGAALQYTGGQPITGLGDLGDGIHYLGSAEVSSIPVPIIAAGLLYSGAYVLLNHIPFGRYIYALGSNEEAAFLNGLPVKRLTIAMYIFSGALSAFAGVILIGRLNSAQPTAGASFEFDAIAAVVVGGTRFAGGVGNVFSAVVGGLLIGVVHSNGMNLLRLASFLQQMIQGIGLVVAVAVDMVIKRIEGA